MSINSHELGKNKYLVLNDFAFDCFNFTFDQNRWKHLSPNRVLPTTLILEIFDNYLKSASVWAY